MHCTKHIKNVHKRYINMNMIFLLKFKPFRFRIHNKLMTESNVKEYNLESTTNLNIDYSNFELQLTSFILKFVSYHSLHQTCRGPIRGRS